MTLQAGSNSFISDILLQPQCLRRLEMAGIRSDAGAIGGAIGSFGRIVLTGMGSSHAALRPLWISLVENGLPAWRLDAAECLGHFLPLIDRTTLVIVASQSGRSAEIVVLADEIKSRGGKLLAITNDADSPLARQANAVVDIRVGPEDAVSTKTYLNTLGVAAVLERIFLERPLDQMLDRAADALESYLAAWRSHTDLLKHRMGLPERLYLLARGPSLAAAEYGALIAKEAARWPVEAQSVSQFRHGPLELADERLTAVVLAGAEEGARRHNRALYDDLSRYGAHTFWLDVGAAGSPFSIPGVTPDARSMLEAVPFQLMSVALAEQSGIPPGEFRHLEKVTTVL
jgi:glucosamine--fructose-6-phosphate aminotransferase (isomerizing)